MCLHDFVYTHRMDRTSLQRCNATSVTLEESHLEHDLLEDDQTYSTVYDVQQQMIVVMDNPAYNKALEKSQLPAEQCNDHGRSTVELSQDQETMTHAPQAQGAVQLQEVASSK